MTTPLVFLGPSLQREAAEAIVDAEYRPPIRRGDLAALAGAEPRTICIVDGEFLQQLAVTPREILTALAAGHRVVGAASMGALRAAELWPFGMEGVGRVFAAYRDGDVERDDEVAVVLGADGGPAATDALIGMRLALREAAEGDLLSQQEATRAVELAASMHFTARTYRATVRALGIEPGRSARLLQFLIEEATDLKAADATEALALVAAGGPPPRAAVPSRISAAPGRVLQLGALPRARKCPGPTSVRSRDPYETDRLLRGLGPRLGITRVADVTQLDTLGIPCFTAVRPGLGPSVYSGKALSPIDARVGAQMEAVESVAAFAEPATVLHGTFADARRHGAALDPERLAVGNTAQVAPRDFVDDWIRGNDLVTGDEVLVPAAAVHLGLVRFPPWYVSSNGLASGNCASEAIAHGLAEVIERDALCLHDLAVAPEPSRALLRALATPPTAPRPPRVPDPRRPDDVPNVDLASLPPLLADACAAIRGAGADVHLRVLTTDVGVPTFACLIHEAHGAWGAMQHVGSGAHPDSLVAARRAITEAAQCRATYIQGVREDLSVPALTSPLELGEHWTAAPSVAFGDLPTHHHDDVVADVEWMVAQLTSAGLGPIVVVDLGDPGWPVSVTKTIVCGAEPPLALDGATGPWLGWRARAALGLRA